MVKKVRSYGDLPEKGQHHLREIYFPTLVRLDQWTGDGRLIESAGFGTRDLPLAVYSQTTQADGHHGARVAGALHEVTVWDDGNVSGRGWLVNNDAGREAEFLIEAIGTFGNSVDLADVKVELEFKEDFSVNVVFKKANVAATTLVGTPAFADARAELVASYQPGAGPLTVNVDSVLRFDAVIPDEIVADAAKLPSWEDFHIPETDHPQKIVVDDRGRVYGHLGLWDSCHDGFEARCVRIPRPIDNYASFNKPGVLTSEGVVETGPIFFAGGHRRGIAADADWESAYGGVENAWADVRVVSGRYGPWLSGRVRPGVADHVIYAARASRISGHWKNGRLKAIVSVNAEGFDVPGSGFSFSVGDDGEITELVASFPPCTTDEQTGQAARVPFTEQEIERLRQLIADAADPTSTVQETQTGESDVAASLLDVLRLQIEVDEEDDVA